MKEVFNLDQAMEVFLSTSCATTVKCIADEDVLFCDNYIDAKAFFEEGK